jgi:hypothetical protein
MRRALIGLLWDVPGYLVGAFGGGYAVSVLSSNTHDRSLEAAMTGAFLFGPLAAVTAFIIGAVRAKPQSDAR